MGMTTPASIAVNVPSTDKCDEHTKKVMKILLGIMDGFSPKGCKSQGMDSYLILEGEFPLVHNNQAWKETNSLFGVIAQPQRGNSKYINVFFQLNKEKYKILNERMNNEFHQRIKIAESKLKAIVRNDERKDAKFLVNGVFFDGHPVHIYGEGLGATLKRRQDAEIEISNVGSAFIGRNGSVIIFILKTE